jgi:hypothetical protein
MEQYVVVAVNNTGRAYQVMLTEAETDLDAAQRLQDQMTLAELRGCPTIRVSPLREWPGLYMVLNPGFCPLLEATAPITYEEPELVPTIGQAPSKHYRS